MIRNFMKNDPKKPYLSYHTMTLCNNIIVIYGGLISNDNISGDIVFLKYSGKSFTVASYEKNKSVFPVPRFYHSADWDGNNSKLLIFGGYSNEAPNLLNQLCILDMSSYPQVVFQSVQSLNISNRCAHSSFIFKRKLFIYGGVGVNMTTKKIHILNDFYSMELQSGIVKQVIAKGGSEMAGSLFKIIEMANSEFCFLNDDLSKFHLFNADTENFIKIFIKFNSPSKRYNYTVNQISDGRIFIFGGTNGELNFNEIYYLSSFKFDKEISWGWSYIDTFGVSDEGYNGHAALFLKNDSLLVHGGSKNSFDPFKGALKNKEYFLSNVGTSNFNPQITNRMKIINMYESYKWIIKKFDSRTNDSRCRLYHISSLVPKDKIGEEKLILHGGESEGISLCNYSIYNLQNLKYEKMDLPRNNFYPQLKGHACVMYTIINKKQQFIFLSGGITKEHKVNCSQKTYIEREMCKCKNEIISDSFYLFSENTGFLEVSVSNMTEMGDKLKRYAHSMVIDNDNVIYMLCGFVQYKGFVFDLVKLKIVEKDKKYSLKAQEISLVANIEGRMYASASFIYGKIFLFGGVNDKKALNDFWVIDPNNKVANCISFEKNFIVGRFGMSTTLHIDPVNENLARIIIFGGSYFSGEKLISGMTSEIVLFHLFNNIKTQTVDIDAKLPIVYGFGEKKVFHSANLYDGRIFIFGGLDININILKIPGTSSYDIIDTLTEYEKAVPKLTYHDWELSLKDEEDDKEKTTLMNMSIDENESKKLLRK